MYRERDRRHNPKHGPECFLQSGAEKKPVLTCRSAKSQIPNPKSQILNPPPTTDNREQTTLIRQAQTDNRQQTTDNREQTTQIRSRYKLELVTAPPNPLNLTVKSRNKKQETRNKKPET